MAASAAGKNVLAASLIAGLAGAAAGVLLAPRSGKATRAKIRYRATDMRDKAEETWDTGKDKAKSLKNRAASVASETGRKAKDEFDEMKDEIVETGKSRTSALSR